jgi:hypothetical protein
MKYKPKRVFSQYEYRSYIICGPTDGKWSVVDFTNIQNNGKLWHTRFKTLKAAIAAIDGEEAPAVEFEASIQ